MTASSHRQKFIKSGIKPDKRICRDCIEDTLSPFNRRFRYPFTACNLCGPGFSFYSKQSKSAVSTTQSSREHHMCSDCKTEYDDTQGRRFQFYDNSCHVCGYKALLERSDAKVVCIESFSQLDDADATTTLLQKGEIVAIKGVGGYFLACDATNDQAVSKLRAKKESPCKPFALMAREITIIEQYCVLSEHEKQLLQSDIAPFVVLHRLKHSDENQPTKNISNLVAQALDTLAFSLPDCALSHLILKRMNRPVVITSGNLSGQVPCIENDDAREKLKSVATYFLSHEKAISNSLETSVVRSLESTENCVINIRFARGLIPATLDLPLSIESAPVRDLEAIPSISTPGINSGGTRSFLNGKQLIISKKFPESSRTEKFDSIEDIQQHHAQIAACMLDNDWHSSDGPVLGVVLGGLAKSDDDSLWGGEFLLADYLSYNRFATFKPVPMFGSDYMQTKPWLSAYAHITAEMGWARYRMDFEELELTNFFESQPLKDIDLARTDRKSSKLASSCTLLFDAVSAAIGLNRTSIHYPDESLMLLESIVDQRTLEEETEELAYPFQVPRLGGKGIPYVEPLAMWQALLGDLLLKTDPGIMSARFHKGLAKTITHIVKKLCTRDDERWLNHVALTGPVFKNKILFAQVSERLMQEGFNVLRHKRLSTGFDSVSAGQAVIMAARRSFG